MNKKLVIGLFGYGCVGKGLYQIIKQTPTFNATIKSICVKDKNKSRDLPSTCFTYNKLDILNDPEINVVVELIDNADDAFEIVVAAIKSNKAVVTANKKMLALHFQELLSLSKQYNVPLLYEASVGGSIPIIRSLEEYYNNDSVSHIEGILNGTTNYILTKVISENKTYIDALTEAQELGFAESNPDNDVLAFDPKYKLTILLAHAFGLIINSDEIFNYGITQLSKSDINFAKNRNLKIKLVAGASLINNEIVAHVLPSFVDANNSLYSVNNEFNAIELSATYSDKQLLKGKGAGSLPTAAAVLSDISALGYNYQYELNKVKANDSLSLNNNFYLTVYLRFKDDGIFDVLKFESVAEEYSSKTYKYIIGKVKISDLIKANLNTRNDVFVAAIEAPIEEFLPTMPKLSLVESIH